MIESRYTGETASLSWFGGSQCPCGKPREGGKEEGGVFG